MLTMLPYPADYIDFLSKVTPEGQMEYMEQMKRYNLGPAGEADCPVYDGMFDYFQVRELSSQVT